MERGPRTHARGVWMMDGVSAPRAHCVQPTHPGSSCLRVRRRLAMFGIFSCLESRFQGRNVPNVDKSLRQRAACGSSIVACTQGARSAETPPEVAVARPFCPGCEAAWGVG